MTEKLKAYDPQVRGFYHEVAKAEILNIFQDSEKILISDEYAAFRADPRSRDLVNHLRRALAEKFEASIPQEAKLNKNIRAEYTVLTKMLELVKHAPGSALYQKAKENLLDAVNTSAEKQFILEERIAKLNEKIQERQEKIEKGLGDSELHNYQLLELRENLRILTKKHHELLDLNDREAELVEKTWTKMESLTGSRALQESLQKELFYNIVDGKRQIDKESVKSLFPHDEWSPLTDTEISVKELIEAYRNRSGAGITIKLNGVSGSVELNTVTYNLSSAQAHMITEFARQEEERSSSLSEKQNELSTLREERKLIKEEILKSSNDLTQPSAADLVRHLFQNSDTDTTQKRFTVLKKDLEILAKRGNDNAADLIVLISQSENRFQGINNNLSELFADTELKALSEGTAYQNLFNSLSSGNYDRASVTTIIDNLEKFTLDAKSRGILDQNQEERI